MTKLLIATDAWGPQINGVVRSLENIAAHAASFDMEVRFLTPSDFWTMPLPGYGEIRLALTNHRKIAATIADFAPDFVHIATEGPIGLAARRACLRERRPFTTSYHTRFPEYLAARLPVPIRLSYAILRRFHNAAAGTMVSSASLENVLAGRGFRNLMRWSRGVDETLFRPRPENVLDALPRPIFLFVGRLAVEKNVEAFLRLDLPGSKVVVGNGPLQARFTATYPNVHFLGALCGEGLAKVYSSADVFVFPSLTDTFGIVLLEALASGVPVAAFPVTGPIDVIGDFGHRRSGAGLGPGGAARARHFARTLPHACDQVHLDGKRPAVLRQYPRRAIAPRRFGAVEIQRPRRAGVKIESAACFEMLASQAPQHEEFPALDHDLYHEERASRASRRVEYRRKLSASLLYVPPKSSALVRSPSLPLPASRMALSRAVSPASVGRSKRRVMKRRIEVVS